MTRGPLAMVFVILATTWSSGPTAAKQPPPDSAAPVTLAAFVQDPLSFYQPARAPVAMQLASQVLADSSTRPDTRRAVLLTLGAIHISEGRIVEAREAFNQILAQDPATEIEQPERMPRPAWVLFSRMRDSLYSAHLDATSSPVNPSILTIGVGDIEANDAVPGKVDLAAFARGLVHMIIEDLRDATALKIVDRQRLDVLREELNLSREQAAVDPRYRVQMGRLLGAQSYLFGQIFQSARDQVRVDMRWVETSTGEVLLSEGAEGRIGKSSEIFDLEKQVLLTKLAPGIEAYLKSRGMESPIRQRLEDYMKQKQKTLPGGSDYAKFVIQVGSALGSEEAGNYSDAESAWDEAAKLDPQDARSRQRAETASTYRQLQGK